VNQDVVLRTVAVVAAVALVAAPHYRLILEKLAAAAAAAQAHGAELSRVAAALLIVAAMWGKIPLPRFDVPAGPAVTVPVDTPSAEMQTAVKPIAAELAKLPMGDRLVWAATWNKAAIVVAGDATAKEVAFTDTRSLRTFTALALDIAWRRLAGQPPGNESLRKALEASYGAVVGTEEAPVSRDIRDRYAAFAKAVAWAGLNGG